MGANRRAVAFGLASVACWSTVATAFKLALQEVDSYQLVFYATATAAMTLIAVILVRGQLRALLEALRNHWVITIVAGMMNPVIYYLVLFKAYALLPAQVAQPINYTWSILLTLMAMVFLKQPIGGRDLVAAAICYSGVFVISTRGTVSSFAGADLAGIALALLSTVIWAGYWIINMRDQREPILGLCLNFVAALPVTLLICWLFSGFGVSLRGLVGSVYIGFVEMAIAFVFWSTALRLTDNAARIANLIFLSPFLSLLIINRVLGEEIYFTTVVGLVLIVSGLLFQQYMNTRACSQSEQTPAEDDAGLGVPGKRADRCGSCRAPAGCG